MNKIKWIALAVTIAIVSIPTFMWINPPPPVVVLPTSLAAILKRDNWTPFNVPREIAQGTIVTITPESGISPRASLNECFAKKDIDAIFSCSNYGKAKTNCTGATCCRGKYTLPSQLSGGVELDISTLGRFIARSQIDSAIESASYFKLVLGDAWEYSLNEIALETALPNINKSGICKKAIQGSSPQEGQDLKGNIFVLTQVIGVDSYALEFYDQKMLKVEARLTNPNSVQGDLESLEVIDGRIIATGPLFLGYKKDLAIDLKPGQGASSPISDSVQRMKKYESNVGYDW